MVKKEEVINKIANIYKRNIFLVESADIEEPVLAETVKELSQFGPLDSFVTDVADETSVEALSEYVFDTLFPID